MGMKKLLNYLSTFPKIGSGNSTRLLALFISALTGGFIALVVIPFILIYDIVQNGHIETDLAELGIFLLAVGGYIAGSGFNVKIPDLKKKNEEGSPE